MEKVYLFQGDIVQKLNHFLSYKLKKLFSINDRIVIKLHMGEKGTPYYIKPPLIKPLIDTLKSIGAKPVLFDTPSFYPGSRVKHLKFYSQQEYFQ